MKYTQCMKRCVNHNDHYSINFGDHKIVSSRGPQLVEPIMQLGLQILQTYLELFPTTAHSNLAQCTICPVTELISIPRMFCVLSSLML